MDKLTISTNAQLSTLISSEKLFDSVANKDLVEVSRLERSLTSELAYKKKSLALFRKDNEEKLYLVIETLLVKLAMSLNIGKNLDEWQITELAGDIYKKYYYLSLEEIILVFKKGRLAEYGKIYDRLDSAIVMEWFHQFESERMVLVEKERIQLSKESAQENAGTLSKLFENPKMQELVKEMRANVVAPQEFDDEEYRKYRIEYLKSRIKENGSPEEEKPTEEKP